jgi:putative ABC transport system permease protein
MLKNYLKISFRKLWREKEYAILNIVGLVVGIAVSLLIVLYIYDELNYDDYFDYSERIYRVQFGHEFGGKEEVKSTIPEMIGPNLQASYPEIEEVVRMTGPYDNSLVQINGKLFYESGYLSAGPTFFRLFSYKALHGDLKSALQKPKSIVLTESIARKYFNRTNVLGESITLNNEEREITAVIEDVPHNTHLQFSMAGHRESLERRAWNYRSADTYVMLNEKTNLNRLKQKLPAFVDKNAYEGTGQGLEKADDGIYKLYLQPLKDIHLNPQGFGSQNKAGPWQYLYIFGCAAILILAIACINYMNIATARSGQHAREVGVRKTIGARREQLVARFLLESVLYSVVAMILAIGLIEVFLPYFNTLIGKDLQLAQLGYLLLPGLLFFAVFIGLLSGSYGAVVMSSFQPAAIMKGASSPGSPSSAGFRRILVTLQFIASIGLILVTVLIYQQMEYVRENRLNQNDDEIVVLQNYGDNLETQYQSFRHELMRFPEIELVTTGHMPGSVSGRSAYVDSTGVRTEILNVSSGYDYAELLGLEVISGRTFSPDSPDSNAVLLNEKAAEWLGIEQAYGQQVRRANGRIVGIIEDFHMLPLYKPIQPTIIKFSDKAQRHILVKLKEGQISGGIDRIEDVWSNFVKERPPSYSFLNDELDKAYRSELRMARIFGGFSGIAIFLACLGLFGLSAYSAHRRKKEIGIRKVFGATIRDVVTLLSKDFMKLVLIGFLISAPLAYYFITRWLTDFQYKIEVGPRVFFISGLAVLCIALATVSWQSIRAALANPVDSLRSE